MCDLETTKILVNEEAKAHYGAIASKKKMCLFHDSLAQTSLSDLKENTVTKAGSYNGKTRERDKVVKEIKARKKEIKTEINYFEFQIDFPIFLP
jgi:hypothetical protein